MRMNLNDLTLGADEDAPVARLEQAGNHDLTARTRSVDKQTVTHVQTGVVDAGARRREVQAVASTQVGGRNALADFRLLCGRAR